MRRGKSAPPAAAASNSLKSSSVKTTRAAAAAAARKAKATTKLPSGDNEADSKTCHSAAASARVNDNTNKIHNAFQTLLKDYQSSLLGLQTSQQQAQQQNFSQTAFERSEQWHELVGECGADIRVLSCTVQYILGLMENYETQFTEAKLASSCLVMMFEQISVEFLSQLDIESEILCLLEIAFSTIKQHSYHSYYVVLMNIIEIIVQFRPFSGRTGEIFAKFDKSLACLRNDTKSYFEAIKCVNIILDNNPIKLDRDSNSQQIFDNLLQNLICIGDIESQLATMELILRVFNSELFQKLSYSPMLHETEFQLLTTIEMNSFETVIILNYFNFVQKDHKKFIK